MTPPPAPLPTFVYYVVVDSRTAPPDPQSFHKSRSTAREFIEQQPEQGHLRIRRARVQLYQS